MRKIFKSLILLFHLPCLHEIRKVADEECADKHYADRHCEIHLSNASYIIYAFTSKTYICASDNFKDYKNKCNDDANHLNCMRRIHPVLLSKQRKRAAYYNKNQNETENLYH